MIKSLLLLLTFALNFCISDSHAETISSNELIEKARSFDGKIVTYKGEAVTAILNRGEHSWINLNDGNNAVGIWCRSSDLNPVKSLGGYKERGDMLEIRGIFHRACPEHGGELDIHADSVKIIELGYKIKEKFDADRLKASAIIFLMAVIIIAIFRKRL